ncbi:MAG: hypothetical protein ABL890_00300 [Candidatus Peribacteraceae bacterium]
MSNAAFLANSLIRLHRNESPQENGDIVESVLLQVFAETEDSGELSNVELARAALKRLRDPLEIERAIKRWMQFNEITKEPSDEVLQSVIIQSAIAARKIASALSPLDFKPVRKKVA